MADLSIAITTKNRWDALQVSLSKLAEHLPEADVMVVDDGSDSPCPYDMSALHPRLQLNVHATSGGLVVRRNELIRNASTPYVMSLDDDSFPSDSNVYGAVELLRSSPEVLCVSLPIYNPPTGLFQNAARPGKPTQCRAFVGCGHVMNREAFLQLGGYNAQLVHQGEEHDLSARGLKRNLVCLQYPDALIHHMESNEGRNWDRMDFFGSRNAVLWNDWYVPDAAQFGSRARRVAATVVHCVSTRRLGQVRGHWASLGARSTMTSFRDRLSPAQYAHWLSLPFA